MFAVIHRHKTANLDLTCALVNVNHANVGTKREGQIGWIIVIDRLKAGFHTLRHVGIRRKGDVLYGFGLAGSPFHRKLARLPLQIFFTAFQQMSRDLFRLLADLACCHGCGRAETGVLRLA